jgi:type II secretory pathway pseudopilin PulG
MARGFSVLEALLASTLVTVAVAGLVPLVVLSTRANRDAHTSTFTAVLAQQKLEQLRTLAWNVDAAGVPVSDTTTDLTNMPERSATGVGLSPSPPGALDANTPGYVDFLDASGRVLSDPQLVPAFTRRWSIEPLPSNPGSTLVIQVRVVRGNSMGSSRAPGEARIATVRTRKAS